MKPRDLQTLNLRLDILGIALAELARSLPGDEAARVAGAIRVRVNSRMDRPVCKSADASVAADLAPILAALRRH